MPENFNSLPSLTSVMASAAKEVTAKSNLAPVQPHNSSGSQNPRYAQIRTAKMQPPSWGVNNQRFAQMYGGSSHQSVTQPNFYSPFLTASSFQVPNTRKEIYLWANWWVNNEPKVAAAINFYTNFPFNGWKLECKSGVVKDFYEKLIKKLNFQKWLPLISRDYHLYGDAFVITSIECPTCNGMMEDPNTGEKCQHKGATWKSISMLNPDSVMVTPGFMDSGASYAYLPSDRDIKIVLERQPEEIFNSMPDKIKALIASKSKIVLDPSVIHHFKHAADPWADYGTSIVRPLFVTLTYKDKLRQANWLIAERLIVPTKIVTVGDEKRPASQSDLDSVQQQLSDVANDPNLTLVVPHAFKYEYVGASAQILQTSNEHDLIDQELLDGLMLNKALLNGEGPAYGNAQVGLLSMNERLETWRREVAQWIEEKIFKPVAEWSDFYDTGEGGQQELIYPSIVFDDLKLKDNTGILQMLVTAQQNGAVSAETLAEQFGLNWDQEVERLRFEQGMNFINSPDVMNTDMNIGFGGLGAPGGVTGNGFGAGLNQPLTPGEPGAETPGAPGTPPPGGEAGAPAGTPPPPPATAETIYKQYKFASNLVNEIAFDRNTLASLVSKKYASALEKELHEVSSVDGRTYVGEIPEDLPLIQPWNIQPYGEPLNGKANSEVKLGAVKQKINIHGYTGLEKKLYQLVMNMKLPLAFYAQYEAGPGQQYILDGAFPQVKLGLEADGEVWHTAPNKVNSDRNRDISLARQGWTILRFTDKQIEKQPQDVAAVIREAMQRLLSNYGGSSQML